MTILHIVQFVVYPVVAAQFLLIWRALRMAKDADDRAQAAQARADAAQATSIEGAKALVEFRLYVAEKYASQEYLRNVEERLVKRLDELVNAVKEHADKHDKFVRDFYNGRSGGAPS